MPPFALFGPLAVVDPWIQEIFLLLAFVNVVTRRIAHERYRQQGQEDGAEAMSRHPLHEATNGLLVVASVYWIFVEFHGGFVMAVLVLGLVATDFFEFEARAVEVRNDLAFEAPKGALVASGLVVAYALFQALFYLVEGYWKAVVS